MLGPEVTESKIYTIIINDELRSIKPIKLFNQLVIHVFPLSPADAGARAFFQIESRPFKRFRSLSLLNYGETMAACERANRVKSRAAATFRFKTNSSKLIDAEVKHGLGRNVARICG